MLSSYKTIVRSAPQALLSISYNFANTKQHPTEQSHNTTMLLNNVLTYAVALVATAPTVLAEYKWNAQRQLADIGNVPYRPRAIPPKWLGLCGGNDIKVGEYGCGQYGSDGTKGSAIYKCVEDPKKYEGAWLRYHEVCLWQDFGGGNGGNCARNQRRKGKKFYPLIDGKKAVCVTTEQVNSN
jgi:hypothetical protein